MYDDKICYKLKFPLHNLKIDTSSFSLKLVDFQMSINTENLTSNKVMRKSIRKKK